MVSTWSRLVRSLAPGARARVAGYPTSSNRASSLHLQWELPAGTGPVVGASVVLTVETEPPVPELYFWALQASFVDGAGRRHGGGHLGLQWHEPHPGSRAANWGGYGPSGRVLDGSASPLPSATGNPNTRDLWWEPGEPHTLTIEPAGEPGGGWAGAIDGVRVRTLGAVAMANAGPDTNGSQFFICIDDCTRKLDKAYNLFGYVTSGVEIAPQIAQGDVMRKVTITERPAA